MTASPHQLTRLLALVPYLQQSEPRRLADIAAEFAVTPRQLLKDLRVLYLCGLPGFGPGELIDINIEALEDDPDGLVTIANADYLARPLRLRSTEATALVAALQALAEASSTETREVVRRTLAKVEAAAEAGRVAPVAVRTRPAPLQSPRALLDLEQALTEGRQAQIDYFVPARDEVTRRTIDPLALLRHDGQRYVDAWCTTAGDRRLFRVDRIVASALGGPAADHGDLVPRDLAAGFFVTEEPLGHARLRLAPPARWVAEHYPVSTSETQLDGSCVVTLPVSDDRWLLRLVIRLAPSIEILDPPELRAKVRRVAEEARQLHRSTAYDGSTHVTVEE